jgi:hypothetical protein
MTRFFAFMKRLTSLCEVSGNGYQRISVLGSKHGEIANQTAFLFQ